MRKDELANAFYLVARQSIVNNASLNVILDLQALIISRLDNSPLEEVQNRIDLMLAEEKKKLLALAAEDLKKPQ